MAIPEDDQREKPSTAALSVHVFSVQRFKHEKNFAV
jgi:hypothetical protein